MNDKTANVRRIRGTVKWFTGNFGFIETAAHPHDFIAHYSEIDGDGYRTLCDGDPVTFRPRRRENGRWAAAEIRVLRGEEEL